MRRAVILSAGLGTRLQPLTNEHPKCLTEVHGKSILWNMLEALQKAGVNETTIVVGHLKEKIQEVVGLSFLGMKIKYAVNADFQTTNTSFSLSLGLAAADFALMDTVLVLEGDVFFDAGLIERILEEEEENVTVVEKYSPLLDGSFVAVEGDWVRDWIHKSKRKEGFTLEDKFKTVNIHKFSGTFVHETLLPTLETFLNAGQLKAPLEYVMEEIVSQHKSLIKALLPNPYRWFEIDNSEELAHAHHLFAP